MIIKVISLQKALSRRLSILKLFKEINLRFDFVDAIDGREMKAKDYFPLLRNPNYFFNRRSVLSPAEVGCRLSHKMAISQFVETGVSDWLMVLEDDVQFKAGFVDFVSKLNQTTLERPVVIHLGGQEGILCRRRVYKKLDSDLADLGISKVNKYTLRWLYRTCGYIINSAAAKELNRLHCTHSFVADDWGFILKNTKIKKINYIDYVQHPIDLSDSSIEGERNNA